MRMNHESTWRTCICCRRIFLAPKWRTHCALCLSDPNEVGPGQSGRMIGHEKMRQRISYMEKLAS